MGSKNPSPEEGGPRNDPPSLNPFLLTLTAVLLLNSVAVAYGFRMLARFSEELRWTILQTVPSVLAQDGTQRKTAAAATEPADTLELFSDLACPVCRQSIPVIDSIRKMTLNRVQWEYRFVPRSPIVDPLGFENALAGVCLERVGRFWEYYGLVGELREWSPEIAQNAVERLGLSPGFLRECMQDPSTAGRVWSDIFDAARRGVTATPTLEMNGVRVQGEMLVEPLCSLLASEIGDLECGVDSTPLILGNGTLPL